MESGMTDKGMHIEVVKTCVDHIDDILIVEKLSFKTPWSKGSFIGEIRRNKFAVYFSAKAGESIVGYAGMWVICGEGHITNVAVHPEYRRIGIGSRLIEALIAAARNQNIESMTLEVRKSNIAAQTLYRKYGFIEKGIRRSYYSDNNEDAVIMWKYNT